MTKNSIGSFIAGAALSLLLVFFFKPAFLISHVKSDTRQILTEAKPDPTNDGDQKAANPEPTNDQVADSSDQTHILSIVERLTSGQNLSNEFGSNIKTTEGKNTADYLADKPALIANIESTLKTIKHQSKRDSIIFVFSNLPTKQIIEISKRLIVLDSVKAKLDGLHLLTIASKQGSEIITPLEGIIKNENEIQVVLKAISILAESYPTKLETISAQRLNEFIADASNEKNQGRALEAKVRLFATTDEIKTDVVNALNSDSNAVQERAIQALANVLYRQNKGRISSDWRTDPILTETLERIANNKNGSRSTRAEVLNLMSRYY